MYLASSLLTWQVIAPKHIENLLSKSFLNGSGSLRFYTQVLWLSLRNTFLWGFYFKAILLPICKYVFFYTSWLIPWLHHWLGSSWEEKSMPVVEHKLHADKAGSRAVEAFSKGFSSLCHLSVPTKKAAYVPTWKAVSTHDTSDPGCVFSLIWNSSDMDDPELGQTPQVKGSDAQGCCHFNHQSQVFCPQVTHTLARLGYKLGVPMLPSLDSIIC